METFWVTPKVLLVAWLFLTNTAKAPRYIAFELGWYEALTFVIPNTQCYHAVWYFNAKCYFVGDFCICKTSTWYFYVFL